MAEPFQQLVIILGASNPAVHALERANGSKVMVWKRLGVLEKRVQWAKQLVGI